MSLGALLLQPQTLERHSALTHQQTLGDQLLNVLQTLAMRPEYFDYFRGQLAAACGELMEEWQEQLEANRDNAQNTGEQFLAPLLDVFNELVGEDLDIENVGDVLDLLLDLAEKLAGFIEALDLDTLRNWLDDILNSLFDSLGISLEFIQTQWLRTVDQLIIHLEDLPSDAPEGYPEFQQQLLLVLKRVQREVFEGAPVPELKTEPLAREMLRYLRSFGLETIQEKASCLVEKIRATVDAGTSIYEFATTVGDSVGALRKVPEVPKGSQYCWYASWLYQTRRRTTGWQYLGSYLLPMVPSDEVWLSEDKTQLILRHATVAENDSGGENDVDEVLYESPDGSEINWYDAPQFSLTTGSNEHFTFTGALSPQFMEEWTKSSSIILIMTRIAGHVIHASEPRNHIPHAILSVWNLTNFIGTAATQAPFVSWWRDQWGLNIKNKSWMDMLLQWGTIFGGSFEGFNTNSNDGFQQWVTILGDDANDSYLTYLWPRLVHESMLSIFTLINQSGPGYTDFEDSNKPKNFEYTYPLTNVWLVFFSWLQSRVARERIEYSHPFELTHMKPFLLNQLLYAPLFGAMAGIAGELTGWALSRSASPRHLLIQMGLGAYKSFGMYIVTSYFWHEGDTNDGKYNPNRREDPADATQTEYFEDTEFEGYGDPNTSPYRLPVAAGTPTFVGQAHQGMFSHFLNGEFYLRDSNDALTSTVNDTAIQVYASDFAHAFQEMVVAIRDGTVVDYFDWIADDINPERADIVRARDEANQVADGGTGPSLLISNANGDQTDWDSWNFIVIQHNDPFGTETAEEKEHDKDVGGASVTTYAIYGHGANGGVRAAFDERGFGPTDIIGQEVRRGENIMQAGDTGVSFHNHLHLHVRPGPAPLEPAARNDPSLPEIVNTSAMLGLRTLPIVFKDATHPLKPNGRLYNLTWYRSGNEAPE